MAPDFLASTPSPRPFYVLDGTAFSSAPSPLQANFNLTCRSPVRQTHHRTTITSVYGGFIASPRQGPLSPLYGAKLFGPPTGEGKSNISPHTLHEVCQNRHDGIDDGLGYTTGDDEDVTPTDRTSFLPHPSSGLPSAYHKDKLGVISSINIIVGKTIGVGAYSVPSSIFEGVGSVGMALFVWVVGSLVAFCGLAVYLDLGTALPKSGGERVYLERIFRRPHMLATCMFMAYVVLLGFSAPNAIVLGENALYMIDVPADRWNVRAIAVASITILCYTHAYFPRLGLHLINVLGVVKMLMLVFVVLSGVSAGIVGVGSQSTAADTDASNHSSARLMGHHMDPDMLGHAVSATGTSTAKRNFQDIWAGSSSQPYDYATALLKVLYCFRGYSTANQVLSDVKNPARTLRVAAPVALALVSLSYLAVNVAFFLVIDRDEFRQGGAVVAGIFFRNIFGRGVGARVLPLLLVIISALGNMAATSFAQARVNEELAKDGLLPFSSFWATRVRTRAKGERARKRTRKRDRERARGGSDNASDSSSVYNKSTPRAILQRADQPDEHHAAGPPCRGLLLHWVVSVLVIVLPPPGKIYNFLVDMGGYPVSAISVAMAAGLLYLQCTASEGWVSPWPAPRLAVVLFGTSNCLLLILPWIPPAGGYGGDERFPYYTYPASALAVLGSGALYWCWWRGRYVGNKTDDAAASESERATLGYPPLPAAAAAAALIPLADYAALERARSNHRDFSRSCSCSCNRCSRCSKSSKKQRRSKTRTAF